MTYILDYTVGGEEMTHGSVLLRHDDPMPGVGDTIRVNLRGRDTVVQVDGVRFGTKNYGIQHVDLECSPRNRRV
jgi:hypothetical protein